MADLAPLPVVSKRLRDGLNDAYWRSHRLAVRQALANPMWDKLR